MVYHIRVIGELDESWADWLGTDRITTEQQENGSVITTLAVDAAEQSTLFGILDCIRDLNLCLVSVTSSIDIS